MIMKQTVMPRKTSNAIDLVEDDFIWWLVIWKALSIFNRSKLPDNPDDQGNHKAENDHRRKREIKPEIVSYNSYVPGKISYPFQFIMKEIYYDPYHYNKQTCQNDIFTGFITQVPAIQKVCYKYSEFISNITCYQRN